MSSPTLSWFTYTKVYAQTSAICSGGKGPCIHTNVASAKPPRLKDKMQLHIDHCYDNWLLALGSWPAMNLASEICSTVSLSVPCRQRQNSGNRPGSTSGTCQWFIASIPPFLPGLGQPFPFLMSPSDCSGHDDVLGRTRGSLNWGRRVLVDGEVVGVENPGGKPPHHSWLSNLWLQATFFNWLKFA